MGELGGCYGKQEGKSHSGTPHGSAEGRNFPNNVPLVVRNMELFLSSTLITNMEISRTRSYGSTKEVPENKMHSHILAI